MELRLGHCRIHILTIGVHSTSLGHQELSWNNSLLCRPIHLLNKFLSHLLHSAQSRPSLWLRVLIRLSLFSVHQQHSSGLTAQNAQQQAEFVVVPTIAHSNQKQPSRQSLRSGDGDPVGLCAEPAEMDRGYIFDFDYLHDLDISAAQGQLMGPELNRSLSLHGPAKAKHKSVFLDAGCSQHYLCGAFLLLLPGFVPNSMANWREAVNHFRKQYKRSE